MEVYTSLRSPQPEPSFKRTAAPTCPTGASFPIHSPREGTIADLSVAEGAFVEAGTSLLKIIDQSQQLIRLDVPPAHLDLFNYKFKDESLSITCQGKSLEARFLGIAPSVDLSSQNTPFLFSVEDTSNRLRSGL